MPFSPVISTIGTSFATGGIASLTTLASRRRFSGSRGAREEFKHAGFGFFEESCPRWPKTPARGRTASTFSLGDLAELFDFDCHIGQRVDAVGMDYGDFRQPRKKRLFATRRQSCASGLRPICRQRNVP